MTERRHGIDHREIDARRRAGLEGDLMPALSFSFDRCRKVFHE
jgi:hypothetical protein